MDKKLRANTGEKWAARAIGAAIIVVAIALYALVVVALTDALTEIVDLVQLLIHSAA